MIVKIDHLSKNYREKKALTDIHLELPNGQVCGLLGPNGSGKTTIMKILAGLIKNYKGEVLIDEKKPGTYTKSIVSYLPDKSFCLPGMKIRDFENYFSDFFADFDAAKFRAFLSEMNLSRKMNVHELSKGMTEKLNLCLILSRNAKLYVIDEPIAGVDPLARDQILYLIKSNIRKDSTMLVTTHLVRDIETIFDRVCFISEGKIIEDHDAHQLRKQTGLSIDGYYKELFSRGIAYAETI